MIISAVLLVLAILLIGWLLFWRMQNSEVTPIKQILNSQGAVVWDMGQYEFLLSGEEFDSMHPSLQRQATLNMNFGLYEVVPDFIYQVRGFDPVLWVQ